MPANSNLDHRGEFSYFYYQIGDYDTTDSDATILADGNWIELCIVNADRSQSREMNEIVDRCSPNLKVYTAGKRDIGLSFSLNELRHSLTDIAEWESNVDDGDIFAILMLNAQRDDPDAWGVVGNFLVEQADLSQPENGNNTESYTAKPAARSAFTPVVRRIYGSDVTPPS